MKTGVWRFMAGEVCFTIEGGQGERFLTLCAQQGIPVQKICSADAGFTASVPARHYRRMHRLARRCRCVLKVQEKHGLCFLLRPCRKRWGIAAGLALGALILFVFPHMIWNIEFVQFTYQQEQDLRQQLYENGIYEGAFADAKKMRRAADRIFVEEDMYSWVALNFTKGRLVVEKRDKKPAPQLVSGAVTDLVATSDGMITSVDLRGGFLQAWPNQVVAEGDVLVSGASFNEMTGITAYMHSEGSVYARVEKVYTCTQPLEVQSQVATSHIKNGYALLIGSWRVPLTPHRKMEAEAMENTIRWGFAPFGFHLPVTVERTQMREMESVRVQISPELAAQKARLAIFEALRKQFPDYVLEHTVEEVEQSQEAVTVTMRLTFTANIAKQVPYSGLT